MSGPYDNYGGGYQQQGGYPPQQGYGSQQGYPPQQGYGSQQGYPHQQSGGGYGGYNDPSQNFGPPRRADSFGPPSHGGFQHGQAGGQYGSYDASNPQGHSNYYGQQQGGGQQNDAYAANQAWMNNNQGGQQQGGYGGGQGTDAYPQTARQSSDPNAPNYDPSAPPMTEQDRGLLGAMAGGAGGAFLGHKAGHGFLGTIGGAIMGSIAEDMAKKKKGSHSGGGSSWGGSSWGGGKKW